MKPHSAPHLTEMEALFSQQVLSHVTEKKQKKKDNENFDSKARPTILSFPGLHTAQYHK